MEGWRTKKQRRTHPCTRPCAQPCTKIVAKPKIKQPKMDNVEMKHVDDLTVQVDLDQTTTSCMTVTIHEDTSDRMAHEQHHEVEEAHHQAAKEAFEDEEDEETETEYDAGLQVYDDTYIDAFVPGKCLACGSPSNGSSQLCPSCKHDMKRGRLVWE